MQAQDQPRTAEISWPKRDLSHIRDIAARLIIEPLYFEWPFPGVADARAVRPGMLDSDDLELQDERRQWLNEVIIRS
jgi:hypothetical protein